MNGTEKAKRKLFNVIGKVVNKLGQNEAMANDDMSKDVTEGMPELLREAAAEGTVLLRNDGILPLKDTDVISVFGRVQNDYIYVGYGSGGDVIKPYTVNLMEGLRNNGVKVNEELATIYRKWCSENAPDHGFWGHWPHYYEEMPIDTKTIKTASQKTGIAVVVIGRAAGEDRENTLTKGSYYLTDDEKSLISRVSENFNKTVIILDIGGIIDMSWEKEILKGDSAILIPWQGGMESGNAVAEVLSGKREPSGRLTDTIAKSYEDYPSAENFGNREYNNYTEDVYVGYRYFETFNKDAVLYPFGFGLGYANFERNLISVQIKNDIIALKISTKNTSDYSGKDVLQIYIEAPQGKLGKPSRVLCAYEKTRILNCSEEQEFEINIPFYTFASYDDSGKTPYKSSYIIEKGIYNVYLGGDVRRAKKVYSFEINENIVLETLKEVAAPKESFDRLIPKENIGNFEKSYEKVPTSTDNLKEIILSELPENFGTSKKRNIKLSDVKNGNETLNNFIAQLTPDELEAISRGAYIMNSPLGAKGNAGVMGGVLPSLRELGIDPVTTTDGPSGIRLLACCSLLPSGTSIASMWNKNLAYRLYQKVGGEMKAKGSDILLAPGMNIHRSPLCGRNFEYYSEDPLLTGKTAAAVVSGLQSEGVAACPKHFACNNQETNRNKNDSRLSERALREIYLKGFEICVKDAKPLTIMTSYNKINGVWAHYHYDLCTRILRQEWKYDGLVMTDWWMQYTTSPEFPALKDNAYRVRAGVDVLMPGGKRTGKKKPDGTLLKTYKKENGITLGEMQRTAKNVLNLVMKVK
ncbi:MAG: beta-glucosidase [Ruminococcaceae bacterium]|nr:beta-glucosidase [Oscillospiraceae bacterium]